MSHQAPQYHRFVLSKAAMTKYIHKYIVYNRSSALYIYQSMLPHNAMHTVGGVTLAVTFQVAV